MSHRSTSERLSSQLSEKERYLNAYLLRLQYWFKRTPTFDERRGVSPDQWLSFVYREWWQLRCNDVPFSPKECQEVEDFEGKFTEHLTRIPRVEIVEGQWWFNELARVAKRFGILLPVLPNAVEPVPVLCTPSDSEELLAILESSEEHELSPTSPVAGPSNQNRSPSIKREIIEISSSSPTPAPARFMVQRSLSVKSSEERKPSPSNQSQSPSVKGEIIEISSSSPTPAPARSLVQRSLFSNRSHSPVVSTSLTSVEPSTPTPPRRESFSLPISVQQATTSSPSPSASQRPSLDFILNQAMPSARPPPSQLSLTSRFPSRFTVPSEESRFPTLTSSGPHPFRDVTVLGATSTAPQSSFAILAPRQAYVPPPPPARPLPNRSTLRAMQARIHPRNIPRPELDSPSRSSSHSGSKDSTATPINPSPPVIENSSNLAILPIQSEGPTISSSSNTQVDPSSSTLTTPTPTIPATAPIALSTSIAPTVHPTTGAQSSSSSTTVSLEPVVTDPQTSPSPSNICPRSQQLATKKVPEHASPSKVKGKNKAKFQDEIVDGSTAVVTVPRGNKRKAQTPDGPETSKKVKLTPGHPPQLGTIQAIVEKTAAKISGGFGEPVSADLVPVEPQDLTPIGLVIVDVDYGNYVSSQGYLWRKDVAKHVAHVVLQNVCDNCTKAGTHCRVCRSYSGKCARCAVQRIPCVRNSEVPQFGVDMGDMPNANFRRLYEIATHFNQVASDARGIGDQYLKKVEVMEAQMAAVLELFRNPLPLGEADGDENLGNVEDDVPAPGGSGSTA
ncbi:hypothetical protein EV421DRAFT_1733369 [Armillaria borealis]|uniref:Uncharacterized protein n=1 Tax=Armillaria borealis TaxID=47425 RepID=A0AA39MVA8_9AGAR|nr:hypothetical protein EV421DRAFT_1733369 [Armillaria borealis]